MRWLVAATAIVVVVAAATSTNLYLSTERALVAEVAASEKASAMYEFSSTILSSVSPEIAAGKDTELLEQILEGSVDRAYETFSDQPESLQMVHETITTGLFNLGRYDEAISLHEQLMSTLESMQPLHEVALPKARSRYAILLRVTGRMEESSEQARLAADAFSRLKKPILQVKALQTLALNLHDSEDLQKALETVNAAIRLDPKSTASQDALMDSWNLKAKILDGLKEYDQAAEIYKNLIDARERLTPDKVTDISSLHLNLGVTLKRSYRRDEALVHYKKALEIRESIMDPMHPRMLTLRNNMGNLYFAVSALDEADESLRIAYEGRLEKLGSTHPWTIGTATILISTLVMQDKFEAARELYDAQPEERFDELTQLQVWWKQCLLFLLVHEKDANKALEALDWLLTNSINDLMTAKFRILRGEALSMLNKAADTDQLLGEAFPRVLETFGHGHCETVYYARSVVRTLRGLGRHSEATSFQRDFIERANQELAESTSEWKHNTRACLSNFEAMPAQQ